MRSLNLDLRSRASRLTLALTLGLGCVLRAGFVRAESQPVPEKPSTEAKASQASEDKGKPATAAQKSPDIDEIIKHFENMYRSTSSISRAELTIVKPRRTRRLRMKAWTKGEQKALIVIESPAREKGTATLKVDKNLWNYLPRISKTIRIPPSMMLGSWMGSDFTNDDLVRDSSFRHDYTYRLMARLEDPPRLRIRLDAKPGVVGLWKRIEVVFTDDGKIPLVADYYDRKGRLARRMRWDELRTFQGRRLPARMVLTPLDRKKKGYRTEMRYLDINFEADVPESTFSISHLERNR